MLLVTVIQPAWVTQHIYLTSRASQSKPWFFCDSLQFAASGNSNLNSNIFIADCGFQADSVMWAKIILSFECLSSTLILFF